jgi:hypothetical protein
MKLQQKVEALTQTVDLIFSMQKSVEEKIDRLLTKAEDNDKHQLGVIHELTAINGILGPLAHNSNTLIAIAQDHEVRIGDLEQRAS